MKQHLTKTVTLIDIENAHGDRRHSEQSVRGLKGILRLMLKDAMGEVVIGTSHGKSLMPTKYGWGGDACFKYREGKDGAELALLDYMATNHPVGTIAELIIVSGDYRFAQLAEQHRSAGATVRVISLQKSLATVLRKAADSVQWLPSPESFATVLAN